MEIKTTLTVKVRTTTDTIWEGEALSVSSINSQGPFDILPEHAQMVTLIDHQKIIVRTANHEEKKFEFDKAVVHIHENTVTIYSSG